MTFGELIKGVRTRLGWTIRELSKKCGGMSDTLIKRIENGKNCNLSTAFKLCKALSIKTIDIETLQVQRVE